MFRNIYRHLRDRLDELVGENSVAKVRRALEYLLAAWHSTDDVTFRVLLSAKPFREEVLDPLRDVCGWTDKDDEEVIDIVAELNREVESAKGVREKSARLKELMDIRAKEKSGIIQSIKLLLRYLKLVSKTPSR